MTARPLALLLLAVAFVGCEPTSEPISSLEPAEADGMAEASADETSGGAPYDAILGGPEELLVTGPEGSEPFVTFGASRDQAVDALMPYLGAPASEGVNEDCPMGPMLTVEWANGLSLLFPAGEDTFAGWRAAGGDERLQAMTPSGVQEVGLGMPRDLLLTSEVVRLDEASTLENEFLVGTTAAGDGFIGGFLSGPGDGAVVNELFSGVTCYAR